MRRIEADYTTEERREREILGIILGEGHREGVGFPIKCRICTAAALRTFLLGVLACQ